VVDILGIVGEHAERAVAADDRHRTRKRAHEDAGDLMLPSRSAVVRALGSDLIDIVDGTETYSARVQHSVDETAAVLAGLALIGRNLVDAEILVVEGPACY